MSYLLISDLPTKTKIICRRNNIKMSGKEQVGIKTEGEEDDAAEPQRYNDSIFVESHKKKQKESISLPSHFFCHSPLPTHHASSSPETKASTHLAALPSRRDRSADQHPATTTTPEEESRKTRVDLMPVSPARSAGAPPTYVLIPAKQVCKKGRNRSRHTRLGGGGFCHIWRLEKEACHEFIQM